MKFLTGIRHPALPRGILPALVGLALSSLGSGAYAESVSEDGGAYPTTPVIGSSVQIYGIVDSGLRHVDQSSSAGNLTQFTSGLNTSRVGLRGNEAIDADFRAGFRLESGFSTGTGGQSNTALFDRTAAASLGWRSWDLKLGRQEGFGYEDAATGATDPLHMALNFPNYSSPAAAGSKAPVLGANPLQAIYTYTYGQLRYDNALRLETHGQSWAGGLLYAVGGVAGSWTDDTARGARISGALGPVSGEALFQQSVDGSGNKSTLGVLAGTWQVAAWTLQAGVHDLHIEAGFNSSGLGNGGSASGIQGNSTTVSTALATAKENFSNVVADLAATWQATDRIPVTLAAYKTHVDGAGPGNSTAVVGLGKYCLSKRTALYLELDHAIESGTLATKPVSTVADATSYLIGINHRF
jgi:predicted porin